MQRIMRNSILTILLVEFGVVQMRVGRCNTADVSDEGPALGPRRHLSCFTAGGEGTNRDRKDRDDDSNSDGGCKHLE